MDLFSSEKVIISVITAANDLEVIFSFQFLKQSLSFTDACQKANIVWLKWKISVSLQWVCCLKETRPTKAQVHLALGSNFARDIPAEHGCSSLLGRLWCTDEAWLKVATVSVFFGFYIAADLNQNKSYWILTVLSCVFLTKPNNSIQRFLIF